jgi:hypothetical protein
MERVLKTSGFPSLRVNSAYGLTKRKLIRMVMIKR